MTPLEQAIKSLTDVGFDKVQAEKIVQETLKNWDSNTEIPENIKKQLDEIINKRGPRVPDLRDHESVWRIRDQIITSILENEKNYPKTENDPALTKPPISVYVVVVTDEEAPNSPNIDIYLNEADAIKKKQKWIDEGCADGDKETDEDAWHADAWVFIQKTKIQ